MTSTTLTIDHAAAIRGLRAAVADKGPGYTYPYVHPAYTISSDGVALQPGCLVGAALHHLGVPLEHMRAINHSDVASLAIFLVGCGIQITPLAVRVLTTAQVIQDRVSPIGVFRALSPCAWGDALVAAETEAAAIDAQLAPAAATPAAAQDAAIHAAVAELEAEVAAEANTSPLVPA